jgi:hypothetical protein
VFHNALPNFMTFQSDTYYDGNNAQPCLKSFCAGGFNAPVIENTNCYGPIEVGACQNPLLINSTFNSGVSDGGGGGISRGSLPFSIGATGQITGLFGLSQTLTPANNVGGKFTLPSGQNQVTITYAIPENDDQYLLQITKIGGLALPDAGLSVLGDSKILIQAGDAGLGDGASRNFIFQVQQAPTQDTVFNWFLYR